MENLFGMLVWVLGIILVNVLIIGGFILIGRLACTMLFDSDDK